MDSVPASTQSAGSSHVSDGVDDGSAQTRYRTSGVSRTTRPSLTWQHVSRLGGVLAVLSYAFLYSFAAGFLDIFGTDPEEVGLTESAFIIRAGLYGALALSLVCILIFIAFIAIYSTLGLIWITVRPSVRPISDEITAWTKQQIEMARRTGRLSGNRIWSLSKTGSDKRAALLISVAAALPVVLLGVFVQPDLWGSGLFYFFLWLVLLSAFFNMLARKRHLYAFVLAAIMVLGLFVDGLIRGGAAVARDVQQHGHTAFPLFVVGLRAHPVTVTWLSQSAPEEVATSLSYLGRSDETLLLSDGRRLLRIPSSHVVVEARLRGPS